MTTTQHRINTNVVALVVASTLLQVVALLGVLPIEADTVGRQVFSTVEMLLIVLLLVQGWRIRQWSRASQGARVQRIASICFYSLLLCGLGDLVNRNYFEQYYQWDDVIKHGYLIQGIGFFFPGYLLIVIANWLISRDSVSTRRTVVTMLIALVLGALAFLGSYDPHVNAWASTLILAYTLLLAVLAGSTLWVIASYGWSASWIVVSGALLAPVADALIGNFWIYRDYFPTIEHVNWILYFASLAMIQQLPFLVAVRPTGEAERGVPRPS